MPGLVGYLKHYLKWEIFEWPPRSPKSAWIFIGTVFIGTVFVAAVLGLIILFSV